MPQKIDNKYKLSFDDSSVFRNNLLTKNLPFIYTNNKTQKGQVPDVHETILSNNTVSDLVDDVAINPKTGKRSVETFILLNKFAPVDGYKFIDFVDKKVIDGTPTYNVYPKSFLSSSYSPYDIFLSSDPNGSNGAVKQDSELAQIGTKTLHNLFSDRRNVELYQNTIGKVSLSSLSDPFDISLLLSGQQPLIQRNWKITAPENVVLNVLDFATRINGAYWPVSPIPGDYFQENMDANQMSSQTSKGLNLVNNLLGGFLGPILNTRRNPSQIFVANTGNGQKSALFKNLSFNKYQPLYDKGIIVGIGQAISDLFNGNSANGGYYVGSADVDPMYITSPANQTPVNPYGKQTSAPVYGPAELGKLYEGNDGLLNFGLNTKPLSNGGGIDGGFVWVSKKTQGGMGNKAKPGGDSGSKDGEYNLISSKLESDKSTNLTFKTNSILDNTQRIVESADNVIGVNKLKHVGTAINQVSKVFNDGYKEITKGSKIVSYKDMTTGAEAGIEYCRVFTKDTPYYTYADLQKTDGITTSGRRFTNSVLDNTYNLNIAPLKGEGSTNIVKNEKGEKYAKKYMFSIENLAWRTSSRPGYTYDELPVCEKGPNGGRVMWFPPYNLKFSDSSTPQFQGTSFLGRPEPIYTYKDTTRSGSLSWTIIVDSPSVMNLLIDKQLKGAANERVDSILNSFFAGCVKFDIYELAKRFNTLNVNDLYEIQEILNNPRLTPEEYAGIKKTIPSNNSGGNTGTGGSNGDNGNNSGGNNKKEESKPVDFTSFKNLMFYFENDYPNPRTTQTTTTTNYKQIYDDYTSDSNITKYKGKASSVVYENPANANVEEFFNTVIKNNFEKIAVGEDCLICQLYKAVKEQKNTITLSLDGSASAPATKNYNVNLSKRRIDCIKNFFKEYTVGECSLKDFIDKEITIVDGVASGETGTVYTNISTPQGQDSSNGVPVNCTNDITITYNGKTYSESSGGQNSAVKALTRIAQVYSTDAMACRRVSLRIDSKSPQPEPQTETLVETVETKPEEKVTVDVKPKKPAPTIDVKQKLKDGISKKILRNLLTECDYFEMIKENDPMIYDSIKTKIKYFNPAFHSMTPEGLNARLTFLNQCVRPGDTIPTVNQKGELIQNNAVNTSFGAPPVLVLRIGDFYNTKIIPETVSFSYEPLVFDLNPEGIGVQPMMVNVTMGFKMIGGMGLKEPVDQLQNALSFNYYANTEIYDERAVWTEDISKLDKQMADYITQNPPTTVDNVITNEGGSTIGDILTNNGFLGEIAYKNFMDKLIDITKSYILTTTNQLEQMTKTYNHVVTTLISKNRNYLIGNIGNGQIPPGVMNTKIYGKPDQNYDGEINKMFDTAINSVKNLNGINSPNYIIRQFYEKGFKDDENIVQTVSENMVGFLVNLKSSYIQNASNILQTIVLNEQDLVININKLNALLKGVDGKIVDVFTPKVYSISGTTNVSKNSSGVLTTIDEMAKDASTLGKTLNEYMSSLDSASILKPMEFIQTEVDKKTSDLGSPENLALFTVLCQTMITPALLEKFKKDVLSPSLLTNKKSRKIKKTLDNACDDLAKQYKKEYESELKLFTKYKKTKTYVQLTEGIESKMYPKGKDRIFKYEILTTPDGQKSEILLNLYRTISEPKNTFNNITKFN